MLPAMPDFVKLITIPGNLRDGVCRFPDYNSSAYRYSVRLVWGKACSSTSR